MLNIEQIKEVLRHQTISRYREDKEEWVDITSRKICELEQGNDDPEWAGARHYPELDEPKPADTKPVERQRHSWLWQIPRLNWRQCQKCGQELPINHHIRVGICPGTVEPKLVDDKLREDIFKILFPYSDTKRASDSEMIDQILALARPIIEAEARKKLLEEIEGLCRSLIVGQDIATAAGNELKEDTSYLLLPLLKYQALKQVLGPR